jgi:hypothetical protein
MAYSLECCCCGGNAGKFKQWWNRDDGYGICPDCIKDFRAKGMSEKEIRDCYGVEGVNFAKQVEETPKKGGEE